MRERSMLQKLLVLLVLTFTHEAVGQANPPATSSSIPSVDRSGTHAALLVEGAPYLMLSAQVHNSSAWLAIMPQVWPVMDALGVNTVEAPVYWETLEPREGVFDYTQVDMLLDQARTHHVHLVLLWFGTWKNNSLSYAPEWVKLAPQRFPLARRADGSPLFSLSPFGQDTLRADVAAFRALMTHLKENDPQHTVLMVQVENEAGLWGGTRDYSAGANTAFEQDVPEKVLRATGKQGTPGHWSRVFGPDADEFFYAWAIARYVDTVAAAGKAVYPLPLYVNAALRDPLNPGGTLSFESGGLVFDVLPIWHAMAPHLDGFEPDIYLPEAAKVSKVLEQYSLPWNALIVPETGNRRIFAHYFSEALAHGAFGWAPFGMDHSSDNFPLGASHLDAQALEPFVWNYAIVNPMMREMARWVQQGQVYGFAEDPAVHHQSLTVGGSSSPAQWEATVSYGLPSFGTGGSPPGNAEPVGQALLVALGSDEFLVAGYSCRVDFAPLKSGSKRMFLTVEEGAYHDGTWQRSRIWNGDQTDYGLNFTNKPLVLRVRLKTY